MTGPRRYGFDDDGPPITLPKQPQVAKPKPAPEQAAARWRWGGLGFVPREVRSESGPGADDPQGGEHPDGARASPRPKLLISGSTRVIDAFRDHCEAEEITDWEAIEAWPKTSGQSRPAELGANDGPAGPNIQCRRRIP